MKNASTGRQLIEKLRLRGTLYEKLLMNPDDWSSNEWFADSPELSRYAQDVRQAFRHEGWKPASRSLRRRLSARFRSRR